MEIPIRTIFELGVSYKGAPVTINVEFGATCVLYSGDTVYVVDKASLKLIERSKINSIVAKSYRLMLKEALDLIDIDKLSPKFLSNLAHLDAEPL